jgi:two-component system chemotaxis sensor kinase CheA
VDIALGENESMLEMYVLENSQLLEQLEELFLGGEKDTMLPKAQIDETFRVMHTIKGSSAMMGFDKITGLAHATEDLFSKIRENAPTDETEWANIFDVVLSAIDFFKEEIEKIQAGQTPDADADDLIENLRKIENRLYGDGARQADAGAGSDAAQAGVVESPEFIAELAEKLQPEDDELIIRVKLVFEEGCQMETVRTFGAVMSLADLYTNLYSIPEDLDQNCDDEIVKNGFVMYLTAKPDNIEIIKQKLDETMFLSQLEFGEMDIREAAEATDADGGENESQAESTPVEVTKAAEAIAPAAAKKQDDAPAAAQKEQMKQQSFINVNVNKIDKLMNLVGEIVTTESMVTKNPDIADLHLENFEKQARQLRKLTDELQDIVMSIRMVPIAATFHKMRRIVRDIGKKTQKEAELVIVGEDTEVDKNIIDGLGDPLMHLIRNAMDHGLETPEERRAAGKPEKGTVTLEAMNSGGDVVVRVADDGRGMDRDRIIKKAMEKGLTAKAESEISDTEAFGFTLMPGFSTKEQVSEYSGRGVGMDVVRTNIENIGGSIILESEQGAGTTVTMHIPLTLAILNGMKIQVGDSLYIVPILSIRESLEPKLHRIIEDPNGNEMIMIRGESFPIVRLHDFFGVEKGVKDFNEGIMILVESEVGAACLFADHLVGEQQVVIKPMPLYISKTFGRITGIAGCSVMGDGGIALILDINRILTEQN